MARVLWGDWVWVVAADETGMVPFGDALPGLPFGIAGGVVPEDWGPMGLPPGIMSAVGQPRITQAKPMTMMMIPASMRTWPAFIWYEFAATDVKSCFSPRFPALHQIGIPV
jgi:hypothetical protein